MNINLFKDQLLAKASEVGFTEYEAYYEKSESFSCRIFEGEIDHYETSEDGGLSFRGKYQGKMGYSYTEKIAEDSIPFLLEQAKENALVLDEDDGSDIYAGSEEYANINFYNPELADVPVTEKIKLIQDVEIKTRAYDPRIEKVDFCMLTEQTKERVLANSKGLNIAEGSNYLGLYISAVAREGEEIKNAFAIRITKDFHELNADEIAKEAAEKAIAMLGGTKIPDKKYKVILENRAAAQLLETYSQIFSAEHAQKGLSLLKGKVGERIASANITILDDPFNREGTSGRNFDSEGVATKQTTVIKDGVLQTLLHNRTTAEKDGAETTGHAYKHSYKGTLTVAPTNFYIEPGTRSFDELVSSVEEGVFITNLSGLHSGTNTVSGDFSVAANGFYVKDGKIAYATKLMTIAGNFFDLLQSIEEAGSDLKFTGNVGSPALLIKELAITVD